MTEINNTPDFDQDRVLADFTDKALNNEPITLSEDKNEKQVEEIVLAVKAHTADEPPEDVKQRIKENAQALFAQTYAKTNEQETQRGLFKFFKAGRDRPYRSRSQRQRILAVQLAVSAAAVIMIILIALPPSSDTSGTTGTATGSLGFFLPLGILILAVVVIAWLLSKNRK